MQTQSPPIGVLTDVAEALRAAIMSLGVSKKMIKKPGKGKKGEKEEVEEELSCRFTVESGAAFNSIVRLCLANMEPALKKVTLHFRS
jgi:hypothetical protein